MRRQIREHKAPELTSRGLVIFRREKLSLLVPSKTPSAAILDVVWCFVRSPGWKALNYTYDALERVSKIARDIRDDILHHAYPVVSAYR